MVLIFKTTCFSCPLNQENLWQPLSPAHYLPKPIKVGHCAKNQEPLLVHKQRDRIIYFWLTLPPRPSRGWIYLNEQTPPMCASPVSPCLPPPPPSPSRLKVAGQRNLGREAAQWGLTAPRDISPPWTVYLVPPSNASPFLVLVQKSFYSLHLWDFQFCTLTSLYLSPIWDETEPI